MLSETGWPSLLSNSQSINSHDLSGDLLWSVYLGKIVVSNNCPGEIEQERVGMDFGGSWLYRWGCGRPWGC